MDAAFICLFSVIIWLEIINSLFIEVVVNGWGLNKDVDSPTKLFSKICSELFIWFSLFFISFPKNWWEKLEFWEDVDEVWGRNGSENEVIVDVGGNIFSSSKVFCILIFFCVLGGALFRGVPAHVKNREELFDVVGSNVIVEGSLPVNSPFKFKIKKCFSRLI